MDPRGAIDEQGGELLRLLADGRLSVEGDGVPHHAVRDPILVDEEDLVGEGAGPDLDLADADPRPLEAAVVHVRPKVLRCASSPSYAFSTASSLRMTHSAMMASAAVLIVVSCWSTASSMLVETLTEL